MRKTEKGKSKDRLIKDMRKEITQMMENTLNFAEVACPREQFKALRSKILRACNDCMRNMEKVYDDYDVVYTNLTEEIIEIRKHN